MAEIYGSELAESTNESIGAIDATDDDSYCVDDDGHLNVFLRDRDSDTGIYPANNPPQEYDRALVLLTYATVISYIV